LLAHATGVRGPVLEVGGRCLQIAERLDHNNLRVQGYFALGTAHLIEAQFADARDTLRATASIVRDRRTMFMCLPWVLALLAEAHLALGEHAEALAAAHEAIDRGREGGCIYYEASAQLSLVQILLAVEGDVPRAEIEAALDHAEELVASVEGRSLSPRILELRGRLAAALGDTAASVQALRDALDLYREIGATGHAERLARAIHPSPTQKERS
jgi:tetratricopeptide (TPR) repeat protein